MISDLIRRLSQNVDRNAKLCLTKFALNDTFQRQVIHSAHQAHDEIF